MGEKAPWDKGKYGQETNKVWLNFSAPGQDPGPSIALLFRHKLTALLSSSSLLCNHSGLWVCLPVLTEHQGDGSRRQGHV